MQVEITNREVVEIRTGKGKRGTYGGKKQRRRLSFKVKKIQDKRKSRKSKGGSGANKTFRFHINRNAFQ